MATQPRRLPLLAPGNEAEWAKINEEKEQQEAKFALSLSIPERLELGQRLRDQAFKFYKATHASGHGHQRDPRGPDLSGIVADANSSLLEHVVIGDLAVIVHGYLCATSDSSLLVPDDSGTRAAVLRFFDRIEARQFSGRLLTAKDVADSRHLCVDSRHGVIDIVRGCHPPLDYETVAAQAVEVSWRESSFRVASLRSLVGFKRLANRLGDQVDLEALERVNGELPIDSIPGLDDQD